MGIALFRCLHWCGSTQGCQQVDADQIVESDEKQRHREEGQSPDVAISWYNVAIPYHSSGASANPFCIPGDCHGLAASQ